MTTSPRRDSDHLDEESLSAYLAGHEGREVRLTFRQLEQEILRSSLPSGARIQPGWWGNTVSSRLFRHCRAWLRAGYQVTAVDQLLEVVTFERLDHHGGTTMPAALYLDAGPKLRRAPRGSPELT